MNEEKPYRKWIILLVISCIFIGGAFGYLYGNNNNSCSEIKQVLYYEELEYEIADQSTDIYDYYDLSSQAYDYSDYDNVIYYCEKSRDISREYSQELRQIKAEYPENPIEILNVRKEMIDTEIEYLFALYQSCEYLESAARAYAIYDYDMGGVNIDGQNEQISIHDYKVEEYYNLDAKYQKLKGELLE